MHIGLQQLPVRSADLQPGLYAWVEGDEITNAYGQKFFKPMENYYPFSVNSAGIQYETSHTNPDKPPHQSEILEEIPAPVNSGTNQPSAIQNGVAGSEAPPSSNPKNIVNDGNVTEHEKTQNKTSNTDPSLIRDTGNVLSEVGGAFNKFGEKRGGLVGKGARFYGSLYSAAGDNMGDVADGKKSTTEAFKDTGSSALESLDESDKE
jgi:hypothetical protein